jgi:hypothetical protein
MKKTNLLAILTLAATPSFLHAQTTAYSDVVGYETKSLPANTYSSVGINLINPDLLVSSVTSANSNSISISESSNVGSLLSATQPYYVEVKSGASEGARLDIDEAATIAAPNGSIVIDSASLNNTDPLSAIIGSLTGVSLALRKHVTLEDVGNSITGLTAGASGTGDEILLLDPLSGGFQVYLRRSSTTWRDANNATVNTLPIAPGIGIIVNKRAVAGSILSSGAVRNNNFSLNTVAGFQLVTLGYPLDRSPSDIGADNVANGWASGVDGDSFMLLNSAGGFDKYLFRTSTSWRDANNSIVTTTKFLNSGSSYVLYRNTGANFDFVKPLF